MSIKLKKSIVYVQNSNNDASRHYNKMFSSDLDVSITAVPNITDIFPLLSVRNGIKSVSKYGICTETLWPYDIEKFDDKPTEECYIDAKQRLIKNYQKVTLVYDMVDALNQNNPIVFGMEIFNGFMTLTKEDSVVYMPVYQSASVGGHAVCIVGYDLPANLFLAKNSFGTKWGDNGYCWIPFAYVSRWGHSGWIFDLDLHPTVLQS